MLRKLFSVVLSAVFLFSSMCTAFAEVPNTAEDKLAAVEKILYGGVQTGAMAERIKRVESEYSGVNTKTSMMNRVQYLYTYTFDNSSAPSLITQMNALEWAISHKISNESMQSRVAEMENSINGTVSNGSMHERIQSLSEFAFGSQQIPLGQVIVPANTLVKIALITPVQSNNIKVGDVINYQVAEDVIEDGMLLFTKGAPGEGVVTKVKQASNFGRNGAVEIDFKTTTAVDGSTVNTLLGQESKEKMENMAMAAGASLAGMLILGPIGIIGGAFVHGKNVDLPEGTELYIQTAEETTVYGIPTVSE